ncbi:alcohol dehydrogenase catalytic domain-containing protein [Streptomyces sp. NPDC001401]|uniref:alcohol dehydrogenase catalytic domain-containing protein n=1 Tax=Streptomyces sp. NPDC001401 TaxID=3364570 RepID=UPI0036B64D6E
MSRAVRFHEVGGPEVLRREEIPDPAPAPGELLIRTRALGLNRAESMPRRGEYGIDPVFPSGVGYEAARVIESVGAGVTGFGVGDAVSVVPSFTMTDYPMHGEAVLAPAHAVVAHSEHLSFEEAASAWMKFITAYGGTSWGRADLTALTGAALSASTPTAYVTEVAGQDPCARVVYRGTDGHVHELYYLGGTTSWGHGDLTAISGAPVLAQSAEPAKKEG